MLNYTKKCINTIALCITLIICIFLFIILDICIFELQESRNNKNINNLTESKYMVRNNSNNNVINIEDTFLELMQKADIYDENTKVEELEQNDENIDSNVKNKEKSVNLDKKNKWRIKIPRINLDAPIKSGTTQDVLAQAVGHFNESTEWNGNVSLAGHNRGYNCNFFQKIKYLKNGDEIIYCTEKGERKYKVILNKIIKQTDWSYIQSTKDNRITLITCVDNMHEYRRCIQAVEII